MGDAGAPTTALTTGADDLAITRTVPRASRGFPAGGLCAVKGGVGMFVAPGARARLREAERTAFVRDEGPLVRERMKRLGIDAEDLLKRERA